MNRIITKKETDLYFGEEIKEKQISLQNIFLKNYDWQGIEIEEDTIIIIDAAKDTWHSLEYFMQQMKQQKKEISKAYLINVDPWIYKWYFGLPFINRKEA